MNNKITITKKEHDLLVKAVLEAQDVIMTMYDGNNLVSIIQAIELLYKKDPIWKKQKNLLK